MLRTEWIKLGALVIPYGTMSAVELSLTDIMQKMVVDDWGQCKGGKFGSLRAHVETGRLSEKTLHAELGQIAAGLKPGRESDDETILFWHRGLSLSDIALGQAMLAKARAQGIGHHRRSDRIGLARRRHRAGGQGGYPDRHARHQGGQPLRERPYRHSAGRGVARIR